MPWTCLSSEYFGLIIELIFLVTCSTTCPINGIVLIWEYYIPQEINHNSCRKIPILIYVCLHTTKVSLQELCDFCPICYFKFWYFPLYFFFLSRVWVNWYIVRIIIGAPNVGLHREQVPWNQIQPGLQKLVEAYRSAWTVHNSGHNLIRVEKPTSGRMFFFYGCRLSWREGSQMHHWNSLLK